MDPSLIPFTALLHLLMGEMIPVYLTGGAAFTAAKKVIVYSIMEHTALDVQQVRLDVNVTTLGNRTLHDMQSLQRHVQCVNSAAVKFMVTPLTMEQLLATCPCCQSGLLDCSKVPSQAMMAGCLWTCLVLTALTVGSTVVAFLSWGLLKESYAHGRYFLFCWQLENSWYYKVPLYCMALFVTIFWSGILSLIIFGFAWSMTTEEVAEHGAEDVASIIQVLGFCFVTQVVCLGKLLKPALKVHSWTKNGDIHDFGNITFKRTWGGFFHHNDFFSVKLVDACWCAKNGTLDRLEALLQPKHRAEDVLQVISELQKKEYQKEAEYSGWSSDTSDESLQRELSVGLS